MTNGLYYPARATRKMRIGITRKEYEKGFWETDKLINTVVGIGNEMARLAISDGIKAVEQSSYYKHQVKKWCRQTFAEQERYEHTHLRKMLKDQQQLFLDFLDAVEKEFRPHIFNIYMSVKQVMLKHKQSNADLKARVECGRICATMACASFDSLMEAHREKFGVDYTALFQQFRYTKPMVLWTNVADVIVVNDHPEDHVSLTEDKNCQLAYDIMSRKLSDFNLINRIGYVAISLNQEIARKYANDDELQELREKYAERVKTQY